MKQTAAFSKLLIANRGEIAVRVIRACQALNIRTVAIYSEADAHALHVRLADEAVPIGPPPPKESYLRGEAIIAAAKSTGAQAIHPGFGFLSENADFADAVRAAGLIFIGPTGDAMRAMGSKTQARALMQAAGVPVVPGYHPRPVGEGQGVRAWADQTGYPVLVKAAAGGGGKGMRIVRQPDQLIESIEAAQREAAKAFGDDTIFLEKYIEGARHIEFQVLGDAHGHVVQLFERECSTQRRHQKIIEETPSPLLDDALREQMGQAAVAAAQAVNYQNAGTIEFIVDPRTRAFYFLEMNTRLQVEHPITEWLTGRDLVNLQLHVAQGKALPFTQSDLTWRGHAIECRLYAEDPANNFLPAVGKVLLAQFPAAPGVRVDSGLETGDEISIHYDPMIAKLSVLGEDRADALRKMDWALRNTIILGVTTNLPFLRDVLAHPVFQRGEVTTDFIEREMSAWRPAVDGVRDLALIAAVLSELTSQRGSESTTQRISESASYDPWQINDRFRAGG